MKNLLPIILFSFLIISCNTNTETKNEETTQKEVKKENCLYSVDLDKTTFKWTAFKTTAKVGVNGSFDAIDITNEATAEDLTTLLTQTKFIINLESINSGNADRDSKLKEFFFGELANAEQFTGAIIECNGDNTSGTLVVNLKMNDLENPVQMKYTVSDNILKMEGSLDLLNWEAQDAITSINEACLDLHKGEDGVSKTWSDMDISVEVPLLKDCK